MGIFAMCTHHCAIAMTFGYPAKRLCGEGNCQSPAMREKEIIFCLFGSNFMRIRTRVHTLANSIQSIGISHFNDNIFLNSSLAVGIEKNSKY